MSRVFIGVQVLGCGCDAGMPQVIPNHGNGDVFVYRDGSMRVPQPMGRCYAEFVGGLRVRISQGFGNLLEQVL